MDVLRDMRNAAIANGLIVAFHVYVALFWEGLYFLIPVAVVGVLIAGAYMTRGRLGPVFWPSPPWGTCCSFPS